MISFIAKIGVGFFLLMGVAFFAIMSTRPTHSVTDPVTVDDLNKERAKTDRMNSRTAQEIEATNEAVSAVRWVSMTTEKKIDPTVKVANWMLHPASVVEGMGAGSEESWEFVGTYSLSWKESYPWRAVVRKRDGGLAYLEMAGRAREIDLQGPGMYAKSVKSAKP